MTETITYEKVVVMLEIFEVVKTESRKRTQSEKKKNLLTSLRVSDLIPLNVFSQWILKQLVECEHC